MQTDSRRKKISDWNRADIKAALQKSGYSFNRIAVEFGYARTSPAAVLRTRWPKMQRIVGVIIGVAPEEIWPSRYAQAGALSLPNCEKKCNAKRGAE
jgi:Ner family transcriptional regulator